MVSLRGRGTGCAGHVEAGSILGVDTTNAGGDLTYSGNIGSFNGAGNNVGFTKRGLGTLILGSNTFTGPLTIASATGGPPQNVLTLTGVQLNKGTTTVGDASMLKLLTTNALPTTADADGVIAFGTGSTLQLYDTDETSAFDQTLHGLTGGSGVVRVGFGTLTLDVPTGASYTHNGTLSTSYNIQDDTHGKVIKNGNGENDFTQIDSGFEGEFILNQGTVGVGNNQIFGSSSNINARLTINGGTLKNIQDPVMAGALNLSVRNVDIAGSFTFDINVAGNTQFIGGNSVSGQITLKVDNPTITVNTPSLTNPVNSLIFAQPITDGPNSYGFTKAGAGTLAFNNPNNDYSGTTTIQGGVLPWRQSTLQAPTAGSATAQATSSCRAARWKQMETGDWATR